jgi:hypothetical protein
MPLAPPVTTTTLPVTCIAPSPGAPIPKFALYLGVLVCELRNQGAPANL